MTWTKEISWKQRWFKFNGLLILFVVFFTILGLAGFSPAHALIQYLINFDDLEEGYTFSPTNQAYERLDAGGRGITIGGGGIPRVIRPEHGARSAPYALSNAPRYEFGSENQDLEVRLNGFTSHYVRLFVGLPQRASFRVTAHLYALSGGRIVDSDEVRLDYGPLLLEHELIVESVTGEIDRLIISYGYDDDPDYYGGGFLEDDAFESELIDSLLIRVWEGTEPPPPVDTEPPVVHIEHPEDGETVSNGVIIGYVEEDVDLVRLTATSPGGSVDLLPGVVFSIVDGSPRYYFAGEIALSAGSNLIEVRAEDRGGNSDIESIRVNYIAPTYHPPPPEWPETLDIVGSGMEVTQAIQGWDMIDPSLRPGIRNMTPLVAGKKTLVRVFGETSGTTIDIPGVGCSLRAYTGGVELPGSPIYSNRVTLVSGETHLQQRSDRDKSFNFILPPEWTQAGSIRLVATVNYAAGIPETDFDVFNDVVQDVTFDNTDDLCVYVYPIRSTNEGNVIPTSGECVQNISLLRQIYPVSPENFSVTIIERIATDLSVGTGDDDVLISLLDGFRFYLGFLYGGAFVSPCDHTVYLGLTDDTVEHRGVTDGAFPVSLSVASNDHFYRVKTGHETGHAMGLHHVNGCPDTPEPYESYPVYADPAGTRYFDPSIGDWGAEIHDDNTFDLMDPSTIGDMMSYCAEPRSISGYTWDRLFDHFTTLTPASSPSFSAYDATLTATMVPYLYVSGMIKPDGIASLNPVWRKDMPAGSSDHTGEGDYTIQLLDSQGATLFERHFQPAPVFDLEAYASFLEVLPAFEGIRTIRLNGTGLTQPVVISAGPSAPEVTVTYPNGGEKWNAAGSQEISWTGSDPDGDPLTYTVFISNDNGDTWQVIGARIKGRSGMAVNLTDLPGGINSCLVRVAASDGINQGMDQSDNVFTKMGQPPLAIIVSPVNAATFTEGEQIIFEGLVSDREDINTIPKENMTWVSDRDGMIGNGLVVGTSGLSRGLHLIQFKVRDNDGMIGSATAAVYIREPLKPDLVITDVWEANGEICYRMKNTGKAVAPKGHTTEVSVDWSYTNEDLVDQELLPGAEIERCFSDFVWECMSVVAYFEVCADNRREIEETEENNNCLIFDWFCPVEDCFNSIDDDRDNLIDCDDPDCSYHCRDTDGDGIPDQSDNCPDVKNPDQIDTDGDNQGDVCDPDDDNDGYSDTAETTAGSDPLNKNSTPEICDGIDNDLDGLIDEGAADNDGDGQADCVDEDDDNDGMPDWWEEKYNFDPLIIDSHLDSDGDHHINVVEYLFGTKPNNPSDFPLPVTIDLKKGFNLFSIPFTPGGIQYTAHSLMAKLGGEAAVSSIMRFNDVAGMFETVSYENGQLVGTDFPIIEGDGYIIYMRQDVTGFRP